MPTQFYLKQNTVSQVSYTNPVRPKSQKMKAIMALDWNGGVRQIVSDSMWANFTSSLMVLLVRGLVSFRRVSVFSLRPTVTP